LGPRFQLLDVAAGRSTSAIHLAQRFGCSVVGVDYGDATVAAAHAATARAGLGDRVQFVTGDAERLPCADGAFDAVICECAFCTFPDKQAAATEFARVLRSGGRVGLSDLTRTGPLPPDLQGLLARGHARLRAHRRDKRGRLNDPPRPTLRVCRPSPPGASC
jgi:arsenite methyltransferase